MIGLRELFVATLSPLRVSRQQKRSFLLPVIRSGAVGANDDNLINTVIPGILEFNAVPLFECAVVTDLRQSRAFGEGIFLDGCEAHA